MPCLMWQEPHYTSINIYAYMDPGLQDSYNFVTAIQIAFNSFNSAPAWNPYMYQCFTPGCGPVTYQKGWTDCTFSALTRPTNYSTPFHTSSRDQWNAYITSVTVTFTSQVSWNNQLIWQGYNPEMPCQGLKADGRAVATHKTGHVVGLGHTDNAPAIMREGAVNYYMLQPDDINGLQYIYPGYFP